VVPWFANPEKLTLGVCASLRGYWTPDNDLLGSSLRCEDLRCASNGFGYNGIMQEFYVYILASKRNGTLYVGMTEELGKRVVRHKKGKGSRFAGDYEVIKLVYFELCKDKQTATAREKQLKKWNRRWKIRIIEQLNPKWEDLFTRIDKE
jgi:putative endonuclease